VERKKLLFEPTAAENPAFNAAQNVVMPAKAASRLVQRDQKRKESCANARPNAQAFCQTLELLGDRRGPLLLQFPYFNKNVFASPEPLATLERRQSRERPPSSSFDDPRF